MASVDLGCVFLNLASDPSDFQSFPLMSSLKVSTTQPGEVRKMANGRLRMVRQAGKPRTLSVDLPHCTRAQLDWLEEHVGDLMCVRDDRGRKFYAVYLTTDVDETPYDTDDGGTSLSMSEVSFSEAV